MEQLFAVLPYLACPIGMGLMMWMMSRRQASAQSAPAATQSATTTTARDEELSALRAELARTRAQQDAIERDLTALDASAAASATPAGPPDPAVQRAGSVADAADRRSGAPR